MLNSACAFSAEKFLFSLPAPPVMDARMKLAVIGSRDFADYDLMERCLLRNFRVEDIDAVISGGARGADTLAARFAGRYGLLLEVIPADWKKYSRNAGPVRNAEIVERADVLVAFWDGLSRGTRDSITRARLAGKRVMVFPCSSDAQESVDF